MRSRVCVGPLTWSMLTHYIPGFCVSTFLKCRIRLLPHHLANSELAAPCGCYPAPVARPSDLLATWHRCRPDAATWKNATYMAHYTCTRHTPRSFLLATGNRAHSFLHSGITPDGVWGTIRGAKDQTWADHVRRAYAPSSRWPLCWLLERNGTRVCCHTSTRRTKAVFLHGDQVANFSAWNFRGLDASGKLGLPWWSRRLNRPGGDGRGPSALKD